MWMLEVEVYLRGSWFPLDWWAAAAGIPLVTARQPAPLKADRAIGSSTPGPRPPLSPDSKTAEGGVDRTGQAFTKTHPMNHF